MRTVTACFSLIIAAVGMTATAGADEPLQHPKASENLIRLHTYLTTRQPDPKILLEPIDDSITFGQFFPDEKFEIIKRGDDQFIPLAIWTGADTCDDLVKYMETDPTQRFAKGSVARYLVPLDQLEDVLDNDCIRDDFDGAPVRLMTFEERGDLKNTFYVSVNENYETGTLDLDCWSRGDIEGRGWQVLAKIPEPPRKNVVAVYPYLSRDASIPDRRMFPAHGLVSITPPAVTFMLLFGPDNYQVWRTADSIHVFPLEVADNLVLPGSQPRLPADVFGLIFDRYALLEGLQLEPIKRFAKMIKVTVEQRQKLTDVFLELGARPLMIDSLKLGLNGIYRQDSLNFYGEDTQFRRWTSRPLLLFAYDGSLRDIQAAFDALTERPGNVNLIRQRW
jgi:hypothetical protein